MNRIYLIRHARPASGWGGGDDDPGLDRAGTAQARAVAERLMNLAVHSRPTAVVSSPLRRCLETAAPLADRLGVSVFVDPAVGEIPTPKGVAPTDRAAWLRVALAAGWSDIVGDIDYRAWRREVVAALAPQAGAAVFSHFVAINAVVSALADGDDRVVAFRPDHASLTILESRAGRLALIERGAEAATGVL